MIEILIYNPYLVIAVLFWVGVIFLCMNIIDRFWSFLKKYAERR